MFVDKARITIKSGKGGNGAVSFRREPFVPEGGPDGGDGGKGGDVIFIADKNLRTLMDFKYKRKYQAENGENGKKKKCFGKAGKDLLIKVPPGTFIKDETEDLLMRDLIKDGDRFIAAKGGKGGRGNDRYKTSTRQAPNFAEAGGEGKEIQVSLELKLIADVGLVGFPSVGKSTLLQAATNARPKIASYHFTTITPNLGVASIHGEDFVIADIAGIIEGAHRGAGIGHEFLRHIERTKVLIHVVDISGSEGRNPKEDFIKINEELSLYDRSLAEKPQIVAANKMDILETDSEITYENFKEFVETKGYKCFPIIAPTGQGIEELMSEVLILLKVQEEKAKEIGKEIGKEIEIEKEKESQAYYSLRDDQSPDYRDIVASKDGNNYSLSGKQLKKIFDSTNFNDIGSLRYLYKYIEKSGGLAGLIELGLEEGDTISLFGYEFTYSRED